MGYRFACDGCGKEMAVVSLSTGEEALCRWCGALTVVPDDAAVVDDETLLAATQTGSESSPLGVDRQRLETGEAGGADGAAHAQSVESILKDVRSWSWWLLGWAVVSVAISGSMGIAFAVTLVLLALGSLRFRHPSMYIVLGVAMASFGLNNILLRSAGWGVFGAFQIIMSVGLFRTHVKSKTVWAEAQVSEDADAARVPVFQRRTETWFPWIGLALAGLVLLLIVSDFVLAIFVSIANAGEEGTVAPVFGLLLAGDLSTLALGVGLASLLSGFKPKAPAIVASALGGIIEVLKLVSLSQAS